MDLNAGGDSLSCLLLFHLLWHFFKGSEGVPGDLSRWVSRGKVVTKANSRDRWGGSLWSSRTLGVPFLKSSEKGFPHLLPFLAQRPSQQCSLFFSTSMDIPSSMKASMIYQGRVGASFSVFPEFPLPNGLYNSLLLCYSPHALNNKEFHVVVGFGVFCFFSLFFFFLMSLFLISIPPSFCKLLYHLGAGKSAFCLQIQSRTLWLEGECRMAVLLHASKNIHILW